MRRPARGSRQRAGGGRAADALAADRGRLLEMSLGFTTTTAIRSVPCVGTAT